MKVSLDLLRQFADFDEPIEKILEAISTKIGEIENVQDLSGLYEGITVGQIVSSRPHPDADKLSVNKIDVGRSRPVQVIAGDKKLKTGDKVAYIPPGNIVPATAGKDELTLEVRKIRGLDSHGMLASEYELNFSAAHEGVLRLDTKVKPGTALSRVYGLDDCIIDVETKVLTHRPDMFGHLGFARELSAALGRKFNSPAWYGQRRPKWGKSSPDLKVSLDNKLKQLVPRFTLAVYDGVIVGPSPVQIQSWLMRLGIRPLNNVVDLTNYLMVVSGQPMHAFDYDKVAGGREQAEFVVRHPKPKEKLKLIDGATIEPHEQAILIANHTSPVGLGGVMGGAATEVDGRTKRVVLEAANFNMYSIRNTSMAHGITSEAVTRFARGQDPDAISAVQNLASSLINDWAGGQAAAAAIDDYAKPLKKRTVTASPQTINRLLGSQETPAAMAKTLSNAELDTKIQGQKLKVTVPTWRPDLNIEADIAEEIGRLGGYGRIPPSKPKRNIAPTSLQPLRSLELSVRNLLSSAGASEVLSYSGVPQKLLDSAGQEVKQAYKVRNALSPDVQIMRLSITPSLLDKVYANHRLGFDKFAIFELGTVHNRLLIEDKLPKEQPSLALVYAASKKAQTQAQGSAYFMARTYLDFLLGSLGYECDITTSAGSDDPWLAAASAPYEPSRRAFVGIGGKTIGVVGEFSAASSRKLRLPEQASGFEIQLERLLESDPPHATYRRLSKYPSVKVDLTLKASEDLPYAKLKAAIDSFNLKGAELDYRPIEIFAPSGRDKNTTFRLYFTSYERTLTQKEVNGWVEKIVRIVGKRTDAVQV